MGYKGGCFVGFFHPPEKNFPIGNVMPMNRIANLNIKTCCKRNELKSPLLCWFCHHCLTTASAHTHVCHYSVFESGRFVNNRFM